MLKLFCLPGSPVFLHIALKNWEEPGDKARDKVQLASLLRNTIA